MSEATALEKTQPKSPASLALVERPNSITKLNMRELKELAEVFIQSGAFTDVKQTAQAMVKIIAGQELGFTPIVSMTGIHFFNGKVSIGANLIASLIKDSGKYEYKITEHTPEACSVVFYQNVNGELKQLGVPVRYTIDDAKTAGLIGKDNWKKYPMDMLFAACIRQGGRRYCADVLRGLTAETDRDTDDTVDRTAMDGAEILPPGETVDADEVEAVDEVPDLSDLVIDADEIVETAVEQAVGLVHELQKRHGVKFDDLQSQFLPEGVGKFSELSEEQAAEIMPALTELLKAKLEAA